MPSAERERQEYDGVMNSKSPSRFPCPAVNWLLKTQTLSFENGPTIMGIVNATPDSFSDGGKFDSTEAAIDHAIQLIEAGAGIVDIGGESTRPYSTPVGESEELDRVVPVVQGLVERMKVGAVPAVPISIDTSKAAVAAAAIEAGAEIINDCLLYTSPSPRDQRGSRMPSSA